MPWKLGYTSRVVASALMLTAGFPCAAGAARTSIVPVDLRPALSPGAVFRSANYLDDPNGSFDIDDVSRGKARNAFRPFPRERLYDRNIKGWLRFALRLPANGAGKWTIQTRMTSNVFDVYYPRSNGTYGVVHAGMLVPFAERGTDVPYPNLPISPELASGQPIYVYVVSNDEVFRPYSLFWTLPTAYVVDEYRTQELWDRFFGGLFFAIIVINLFLAFYLRERTFIAYVAAMALHVLTQFTQDGTAWALFWPHASVPYTISSVIVEGLFFASLAIFWRSFLNLPRRYPVLDRILLGLVGLALVRNFVLMVLPRQGWLSYTDFPIAYCLILTALVAAIAAARSGYRPARFLIVALGGLLFFWGIAYDVELGYDVPPGLLENLVDYGIYYGVAWDALFLTFALADRIETAKRNMIAAQQESLTAQQGVLAAQAETVDRLRERDAAVSRFLPRAFLEFLGRASVVDLQLGDHVESEMTILFSDIRSFTQLSEMMSPGQTFDFLNSYLRLVGPIIREHEGFVDKYIGDALMGLFPNAAHTAVDAAIEMQRGLEEYNRERARAGYPPIAIGVGLHRGMLMLGAIGESERIETTVIADAVNIAARTESITKQFRAPVIATEAVISALAGSHPYQLRPLGEVIVYGSSRGMEMFEIFDGDTPDLLLSKVRTLDAFSAGVNAFTAGDFVKAADAFARVLAQSSNDRTASYFHEQSRVFAEAAPSTLWDGRIRMDVK
jgi:class 3 adenylate cyclase